MQKDEMINKWNIDLFMVDIPPYHQIRSSKSLVSVFAKCSYSIVCYFKDPDKIAIFFTNYMYTDRQKLPVREFNADFYMSSVTP